MVFYCHLSNPSIKSHAAATESIAAARPVFIRKALYREACAIVHLPLFLALMISEESFLTRLTHHHKTMNAHVAFFN